MQSKDQNQSKGLVKQLANSLIFNIKNYWHILLLFLCLSVLSHFFRVDQLVFLAVYFWLITCSYIATIKSEIVSKITLEQCNKEIEEYQSQIKKTTEAIKAKEIEFMDKLKSIKITT